MLVMGMMLTSVVDVGDGMMLTSIVDVGDGDDVDKFC